MKPNELSAFPCGDQTGYAADSGMTLRDWFAGQVVAEAIRLTLLNDGSWDPDNAAATAYEIADAMLAEREREPEAPR